jgi:hypothetical protein
VEEEAVVESISMHSRGVPGISSTTGHAAAVVASHWDDAGDRYINKYSTYSTYTAEVLKLIL